MDANPTLVLSKELASGERLLWSGRPQQGVVVRSQLLVGPDGQTDRLGIGVQLVGPRSGVIPMPM